MTALMSAPRDRHVGEPAPAGKQRQRCVRLVESKIDESHDLSDPFLTQLARLEVAATRLW